MKHPGFAKILTVFLTALFAIIACAPTTAVTPVPPTTVVPPKRLPGVVACAATTVKGVDGTLQWDCTLGKTRKLIISNVPTGTTPYSYPFDEASLLTQPKDERIGAIISVAADIRFFKDDDPELAHVVTSFDKPVQIFLGLNAQDKAKVLEIGGNLTQLFPIIIDLDKPSPSWKPVDVVTLDNTQVNDEKDPGLTFTFTTWGDPPAGWGVPPR